MRTPKLIPMEQLEKAQGLGKAKPKVDIERYTVGDKEMAGIASKAERRKALRRVGENEMRSGGAKGADKNSMKSLKDEAGYTRMDYSSNPTVEVKRDSGGVRAPRKHTGDHWKNDQSYQFSQKQRLDYASVQLEKALDNPQPSPFFLQKNINLQKNMDEYLDVYDEILQKAGMDWGSVTDEDFARLEKIDLGRFFGRGKKEDKPKKTSGDRAAAAQKVQAGIQESQRRAGLSDVSRRREDVSSSMKEVKESRAGKLARGIASRAGRAKQKVDQRENIGRKIGQTKDAGIARGKAGVTATRAGATEARRRGGKIKDIATTAARSGKDVATSGKVQPKINKPTWQVGNAKTQGDYANKFNPPKYDNPYRRMKQDQAAKAASRASNPTPQQGVDAAAATRRAMAGGLSMSKASISLQKFLDDCGCDD